MFGFTRSLKRRSLAIAGAVTIGIGALAGVQASASGVSPPKLPAVPQGLSLKQQAAQARSQLAAHPQAAATNVHCGQTITATTTLNGDLNCSGQNGLTLGANSITLNLGGHFIFGSVNVGDGTIGVRDNGNSDTIENGYINGFTYGVFAVGTSDTVTKLQVNYTQTVGIYLAGATDKATSNTVAENFATGLDLGGSGQTAQSNHLLNNANHGLVANGSAAKVLDNIADGNTGEGIYVAGIPPSTVTGDTANYNTDYGIDAISPQIDGGTNTAKGNTNAKQCNGVVCS